MLNRRIFQLALIAPFTKPTSASAADSALTGRERELHEKLLDISALVRAGVAYQDYTKQLPELIVLFDRYERSGGTDLELEFARNNYLRAKGAWDDLLRAKSQRTPSNQSSREIRELELKFEADREEVLQGHWNAAAKHLETYETSKREPATPAAQKNSRVSAPAKKASSTR